MMPGATLESGGNYFWSNGNSMKSGETYKHPNGVTFRNSTGSMFYSAGDPFYKPNTGEEFYPGSQTMRSATAVYSYETGAQLDNSNVIFYPNGATMIAANGNVFNADGSPATTPFSQHDTFTNSEVTTTVSNGDYAITIAAKQTVSGSPAAYVTRINPVYPVRADYNLNGHVDASDYVLWRKNLTTVTPLPNDNGLGTPIGPQHYDLWRANFGQIAPASGAGAGLGQAVPDELNVATSTQVVAGVSDPGPPAASVFELFTPAAGLTEASQITVVGQAAPDESIAASLQLLELQPRPAATDDLDFVASRWADDGTTQAIDPALTAVDDAFALLATEL